MNSLDNSNKIPASKAKKTGLKVIKPGAEAPSAEPEQTEKPIKLDGNDHTLKACRKWLEKHNITVCYCAYYPVGYGYIQNNELTLDSEKLLRRFINRNQNFRYEMVRSCFAELAEEAPIYNPVINALEALPELPDPDYDYIAELAREIAEEGEEKGAAEAIFLWLKQAIAAAYNGIDGNEDNLFAVPYVLLLMGKQGAGKTTFFANLARAAAGEKYFCQLPTIPTEEERDKMKALLCAWLIELGEFEQAVSKRRAEENKFQLSCKLRHYRPQRGKEIPPFPVRQVFGGTTNSELPLIDPTGNRRFLPVRTKDSFEEFILSDRCIELMKYCWRQAYNAVMQIYATEGQRGLPKAFEPSAEQKKLFAENAQKATFVPFVEELTSLYFETEETSTEGAFNIAVWGVYKNAEFSYLRTAKREPAGILQRLLQVKPKYPALQGLTLSNLKNALRYMEARGMIKGHIEPKNRTLKYDFVPLAEYQKNHAEPEPEQPEQPQELKPEQQPLPGMEPEQDLQKAALDAL